ncbi:hypothetical protein K443DRAFT_14762 [Laccaria amethystina LaAM-08-1]|uniref:60S ribosomal protein L14 n=1 Tax=Laccaria amethystina LaAM-08-1 TaxID=1095629 RepID=A0A0C9WSJ4_9AGAR|nr:hypothetical protein K443DRAFT_14762 [Laccaria amethystina LaAM-08-1]
MSFGVQPALAKAQYMRWWCKLQERFVEVGRVVLLKSGAFSCKIAVIVEMIDHNRAIIDGPTTDVPH